MSTFEAAIVVRFGEGVDSSSLVVVELDEVMNVNAAGEVRSTFPPGVDAWFLVHLEPGLMVGPVASSGGTVQKLGKVDRDREQDIDFGVVGDTATLSHIPIDGVEITWEGRDGMVERIGRQLTAVAAPAIGVCRYRMRATQCRFIPPPLDLAADQSHRVRIEITIERAS